MRHLLALIEGPDHVAYRYRLAAYGPALAEAGWNLQATVMQRSVLSCVEELQAAALADAVIVQRRLFPWWRLWLLRKAAKLLIFDVDDAVLYRDSNTWKSAYCSRRAQRFENMLRQADAVTAGNDFLLDQAAARGTGAGVHYFPTCIEPDLYVPAHHHRAGRQCRLVWIGCRGTAASLSIAQTAIAAAAQRVPGLELRIICDWFPELAGVRIEPRRWSSQTEAADLAQGDVGISWLPEHPWSLGKCGLKVLQYMAAGLPVVANPIGIHRQLVVHGETGFLASTPEQWADAVARLAASPELRAAMGRAGRRFVSQHYNAAHWAERFAGMLNRLGGNRPRAAASVGPPHWLDRPAAVRPGTVRPAGPALPAVGHGDESPDATAEIS